MFIKKFVAVAVMLASSSTTIAASCWKISDLKGQAYYHAQGRKFLSDGFGSRSLYLLIDGNNSMMSNTEGMTYLQVGSYSVFGMNVTEGSATHESWLIDPSLGIAYYTKAMTGSATFATTNLDGVRAFVGKAERCSKDITK